MRLSKGFRLSEKIIIFLFKSTLRLFFKNETSAEIFGRQITDKANSYLYYVDLVRLYKTKRDFLNKKEITELLKNIERFEKTFLDEDVENQNCFFFYKDKSADFEIVTIFELIDFYSINLKRFIFLCNFSDALYEKIIVQIDAAVIDAKKNNNIHVGVMDFIMNTMRNPVRRKKDWLYHYHLKLTEKVKIYESIKRENLNSPSNFFE